jgi:hypothetical protein
MERSGYFAMNKLPEKTALGYVEEAEGWRTNIYTLPIVGASDGGAFTTAQDIETLWRAFWGYEILPQALVEIYTQPYVKASAERIDLYYGHGIWMRQDASGNLSEYITGSDAGVSFRSIVNRADGLQITVLSNTSDGAWPILRAIDSALKDMSI